MDNLAEQFQQINVGNGLNYCDLPTEVKMECIKRMDFQTRWFLRSSSHAEREIVESAPKCHVGNVQFFLDWVTVATLEDSPDADFSWAFLTDATIIRSVLRMASIKELELDCDLEGFETARETAQQSPLVVRNCILENVSRSKLEIVKNIRGLVGIAISFCEQDRIGMHDLEQLYEQMFSIQSVKIRHLYSVDVDDVIKMIRNLLENDRPASTSVDLKLTTEISVEEFREKIKENFETKVRDREVHFSCYISMGKNAETVISVEVAPLRIEMNLIETYLMSDDDEEEEEEEVEAEEEEDEEEEEMEGKNYCDLPEEIRLECIKWMDFKTRWFLRSTSHSERNLVDCCSRKCWLKRVEVEQERIKVEICWPTVWSFPVEAPIVELILKMAKVEYFDIGAESGGEIIGAVRKLAQKTPLDIKKLTLDGLPPNENLLIIENCRGIRNVDVSLPKENKLKFGDVDEQLFNLKVVFLSRLDSIQDDDIIKLFEKWIEDGKEQRSFVQVGYSQILPSFVEFLEKAKRKYEMIIKRPNYEYHFHFPTGEEKFVRLSVWPNSFEIDVVRSEITSDEDSDSDSDSSSSSDSNMFFRFR